jgi:NAD(P)-dependent dehydrogenase (short-subunit alcohol dehydrogenase family)
MIKNRFQTPPSLKDKVAIVTGAGKGVGRAMSLYLASCGVKVLVNNRRHPSETDAQSSAGGVVQEILAQGGQAQANYDDALDPDSGRCMVDQAMNAWGSLDMVYANAAISQHASFHSLSVPQLMQIIETGVVSTLSLFHAAWPIFKEQRFGRALATTSSAGRFGNHGLSAYAASKGAIESLVRSLAHEGEKHNIYCNAISPYAYSQMTASHLPSHWINKLQPETLAPAVAWLLSKECTLNGEVLVAGGGRYARAWPVETDPLEGQDLPAIWQELLKKDGKRHKDSVSAFESFMVERNGSIGNMQ